MTKIRLLILVAVIFVATPLAVSAFEIRNDESVYIGQDEVIEGNLYAAGNTISVDGEVTGDIICGGQTININGKVGGDIICGGQSININSKEVGGSVRVIGNVININSKVAKGVQAVGATINLGNDAEVGQDMLIAGAVGDIRGKVGGDLHGAVENLTLAGEVGGDVKFKLADCDCDDKKPLTITKEAVVGGSVIYTANNEGEISEEATISGEVTRNQPKARKAKTWQNHAWGKTYSIFAALVIGLVLISLWRRPIINLTDKMLDRIWPSIGWGVVVMFLAPIIAILLMITVIGIPLALLLIAIWLIALCLSKVLVGIMIGRAMLEKLWQKKKDSLIWTMIIGVIAVKIIFAIPVIGWLLTLVAMWWGLGGIWLAFRREHK